MTNHIHTYNTPKNPTKINNDTVRRYICVRYICSISIFINIIGILISHRFTRIFPLLPYYINVHPTRIEFIYRAAEINRTRIIKQNTNARVSYFIQSNTYTRVHHIIIYIYTLILIKKIPISQEKKSTCSHFTSSLSQQSSSHTRYTLPIGIIIVGVGWLG